LVHWRRPKFRVSKIFMNYPTNAHFLSLQMGNLKDQTTEDLSKSDNAELLNSYWYVSCSTAPAACKLEKIGDLSHFQQQDAIVSDHG